MERTGPTSHTHLRGTRSWQSGACHSRHPAASNTVCPLAPSAWTGPGIKAQLRLRAAQKQGPLRRRPKWEPAQRCCGPINTGFCVNSHREPGGQSQRLRAWRRAGFFFLKKYSAVKSPALGPGSGCTVGLAECQQRLGGRGGGGWKGPRRQEGGSRRGAPGSWATVVRSCPWPGAPELKAGLPVEIL